MLSVSSPQGSSHSDQETFHQCSGGVRPVATLCVGVARVYRAQGECHGRVGGQSHHPVWLPPLSVCVFQTTPTLLALMGIRYEGLVSAIVLPLLLTMVTLIYTPPELTEYLHTCFTPGFPVTVLCLGQVLFLGPLMQQVMDCPWSLIDGIRVLLGETV